MNRHVILTLGRSGSNFLVDIINQHPNLLNYGEVLGDWMPVRRWQKRLGLFRRDDAAWLDFLLGNRAAFHAAQAVRAAGHARGGRLTALRSRRRLASLGIKEFSLDLRRLGLDGYLKDRPGIRVIALHRRSALDRTISSLMLGETGVVAAREGTAQAVRELVRIEPERFVAALSAVCEENAALERIVDELPAERVHRLAYEDMFGAPDSIGRMAEGVYGFLGAGPFAPRVRMRKILPSRPEEVVENFHACRDAAVRAGHGTLFG